MTATRSYHQTPKTNRARNRKSSTSRFTTTSAITCEAVTDRMGNYLCNDLGVHQRGSLETHLKACRDCSALLSTYKKTIELTHDFLNRQRSEVRPVNFKLRLSSNL
jgi:hypothetical protein